MRLDDIDWVEVPSEVRGAVEPILARFWPMVPTWVQEFGVRYSGGEDNRASITANYPNRWATLRLSGHFLDQIPREREDTIVHELIHVCLWPLSAVVDRIVEEMITDGTPGKTLVDQLVCDALESSTEDMARGIWRMVASP